MNEISDRSPGPKRDIQESNPGKSGGFSRVREFHPNGEIAKAWFTSWNPDATICKDYSQYDELGKKTVHTTNTFDAKGNIIAQEQKIGDTVEGEEIEYEPNGKRSRKLISIYHKNKYVVFIRDYKSSNSFYAIVDGNPPQQIEINLEQFYEAEEIFKEKLFNHSVST